MLVAEQNGERIERDASVAEACCFEREVSAGVPLLVKRIAGTEIEPGTCPAPAAERAATASHADPDSAPEEELIAGPDLHRGTGEPDVDEGVIKVRGARDP